MTNITRDEFETVKELLGSAARYAESAHRGLDRLEMTQQRSQLQIDQLTVKMDQLTEAEQRTDQRLESFIFESQRLIAKHSESIEQIKGMTERLDGVLAYLIRKEGRDG
jgi:hypothetical protein